MAAQSNTRRRALGSSIALLLLVLLLLVGVATEATATLYNCSSGSRYPLSGDEAHSGEIPMSLNLYGEKHGSLYVSVNGIVQFGNPPENKVSFADNDGAFIAPFYGDLFVKSNTSYKPFYCTGDASNQSASIAKAKEDIKTYKNYTFEPEHLVIATWNNTGYYDKCPGESNLFQCVIASDEEMTFVLFIYDKLSWCPEIPVRVGFKNGTSVWEMPCSGNEDIITLVNTSNVGVPGVWVFRVDQDIEPACPDAMECGQDGICSCLQNCNFTNCQCDSCRVEDDNEFCSTATPSASTLSSPNINAPSLIISQPPTGGGNPRGVHPAAIIAPTIALAIIVLLIFIIVLYACCLIRRRNIKNTADRSKIQCDTSKKSGKDDATSGGAEDSPSNESLKEKDSPNDEDPKTKDSSSSKDPDEYPTTEENSH